MVLSSAPKDGPSMALIEVSVTAIVIALAFCWPRLGSTYFAQVENIFGRLARRRNLSVAVVGFAALLLRLAILPLCPMPIPFAPDDFSFVLAADTFASGRLTNPTPAMWTHLESVHITMKPTYMSMYFPAQGLVLAAGKVLTGHHWYGSLFVGALMCASICWMLQAWLPPAWALLGGILAVLRLCLFSYWVNIFSGGGGSIAALGGALVLGALPRIVKRARPGDCLLMAVGIVLMATSRPYEGLLLCLPVAVVLAKWIFNRSNRPTAGVLLRRAAIPVALIVAAGMGMAHYDYRAFGNPTTLPYTINRTQYAMAPYFVWQSARPEPAYRQTMMRTFYQRDELDDFEKVHSLSGFVPETLQKAARGIVFYAGLGLLVPLIMLRRVFLDRRIRFLVLCCLVLVAGELVEIFFIPHYVAPFTAAFYAIGLQAMRHLRVWRPDGQPVGMVLVRLTVTVCFVLAGVRVYAKSLNISVLEWPGKSTAEWYGSNPGPAGMARAQIEAQLEKLPTKQLILVRYSADHDPAVEWVYNAPDVNDSRVVWAWDMGAADNLELVNYFKDRTFWLAEPDKNPAKLSLYSVPTHGSFLADH
jgi:hypothetical protein